MQEAEFLQGQLGSKRDKNPEEERQGGREDNNHSTATGMTSLEGRKGQMQEPGKGGQGPLEDVEKMLLLTSCLGRSRPSSKTA